MPRDPVALRLCELNVENLFVGLEYWDGRTLDGLSEAEWRGLALPQLRRWQKPLRKLWGLAEAIGEIDPDVLMLVEVGGEDSLRNFNQHFLADRFEPFFVGGNSRRGIDLAYLVKRGIPLAAEARSNRETPVEVHGRRGRSRARLSRDVAELSLRDADGQRLVLLLVHLKSMISTVEDMRGKDARTAEAFALASLYEELRARHPTVPFVVAGDFNAAPDSLELEVIRRTDLSDVRDLVGVPPEERATLVHFDSAGAPQPVVLDHVFVSPELRDKVTAAYTYRYAQEGIARPLPRTWAERARLPSDHYPIVVTLLL